MKYWVILTFWTLGWMVATWQFVHVQHLEQELIRCQENFDQVSEQWLAYRMKLFIYEPNAVGVEDAPNKR